MYNWYQKAEVCYVYLADICLTSGTEALSKRTQFVQSRWFKRGWTLQELLAPEHVVFYDRDWIEIGGKSFLEHEISEATRISSEHMKQPRSASVATKMSWASDRETSREEDMAYSLLGLFNINLPLIYGEGKNAFFRLQSEIIRTSSDESIYAWSDGTLQMSGLLAQGPWAFKDSSDIVPMTGLFQDQHRQSPPYMTSRGLAIEIEYPAYQKESWEEAETMVPLYCARAAQIGCPFKLYLKCHGQTASRVRVSQIEFYVTKFHEWAPPRRGVDLLYVKNEHVIFPEFSTKMIQMAKQCSPINIKLTNAAQNQLISFNYLQPHRGFGKLWYYDATSKSLKNRSKQVAIWFHFHHGFKMILAWEQDQNEWMSEVRIYSSSSLSSLLRILENSSSPEILSLLPAPTSLLSEPYDSTTLPLENGEFVWIKTGISERNSFKTGISEEILSRVYTVHIDITSIDRSRLLTKKSQTSHYQ